MNKEEAIKKLQKDAGYRPPIELTCFEPALENVEGKLEEFVFRSVYNVGITVDKEELIKALAYDRDQYQKGYEEGHIDGFAQAEMIYAIPRNDWVPCSERLPEKNGFYLVTMEGMCKRYCRFLGFDAVRKRWGYGGVVAWKECEPYDEVLKGGE